jgi:hypothetical protein
MEYHKDRFEDFSLLIFTGDKLTALLPANKVGNKVYSHQGLTFGGLLLPLDFSCEEGNTIMNTILQHLKTNGITNISTKLIPEFYWKKDSKEMEDYLLSNEALMEDNLMVFAIDYQKPISIHKAKLRRFRNNKYDFVIRETKSFKSFWEEVLIPRLRSKHNVEPVHSLHEISLLASQFPNQIKQFNIYLEGSILAGITIFDSKTVVKSQYGATTNLGEKTRALDYLFLHLIYKYQKEGRGYFSMGTVTEKNELGYNPGLKKQKEELGCRIYNQKILNLNLT